MKNSTSVEEAIKLFTKNNIGRGDDRLREIIWSVYKDVDLEGKMVLDVGCGEGIVSFPPAILGAKQVVSLEPELDGSAEGFNDRFHAVADELNLSNVNLKRITLQDYDYAEGPFDFVVMYNVVNHLDEDACISLLESEESRARFNEIFRNLYENLNPGAEVIISDCARSNLYSALGVKNPFAPTIEWEKHQDPNVWITEMEKVGFVKKWSRWNPLHSFGPLRPFCRNAVVGYLTNSHFIFSVTKPNDS